MMVTDHDEPPTLFAQFSLVESTLMNHLMENELFSPTAVLSLIHDMNIGLYEQCNRHRKANELEFIFRKSLSLLEKVLNRSDVMNDQHLNWTHRVCCALCQTLSIVFEKFCDDDMSGDRVDDILFAATVHDDDASIDDTENSKHRLQSLCHCVEQCWSSILSLDSDNDGDNDDNGDGICQLLDPISDLTLFIVQALLRGQDSTERHLLRSLLMPLWNKVRELSSHVDGSTAEQLKLLECCLSTLSKCVDGSHVVRNLLFHNEDETWSIVSSVLMTMTMTKVIQSTVVKQHLVHMILVTLTERIGSISTRHSMFSGEAVISWLIDHVLEWTISSRQGVEIVIECLQFIYMASQSLSYQKALIQHANKLIRSLVRLLGQCEQPTIQYFILRTWREWIDEACDHLIGTESVKQFMAILLEPVSDLSRVTRALLPLCDDTNRDVHPKVKKAAIDLFVAMYSQLNSTTSNMHLMADHLQLYLMEALVRKSHDVMQLLPSTESLTSVVGNIMSQNRLMPGMVQAGVIPMIQSDPKLKLQYTSVMSTLKSIESEMHKLTAAYSTHPYPLFQGEQKPLDKEQLEDQRGELLALTHPVEQHAKTRQKNTESTHNNI